jgi:hypothetical protein
MVSHYIVPVRVGSSGSLTIAQEALHMHTYTYAQYVVPIIKGYILRKIDDIQKMYITNFSFHSFICFKMLYGSYYF